MAVAGCRQPSLPGPYLNERGQSHNLTFDWILREMGGTYVPCDTDCSI